MRFAPFMATERRDPPLSDSRRKVVWRKQAKWLFQWPKRARRIVVMKTIQQFKPLRTFCALSLFLMAVCCGLFAASQPQYIITDLTSLGGTNSRANSINNLGWLAGYSNLAGNQSRHAALWRDGALTDL